MKEVERRRINRLLDRLYKAIKSNNYPKAIVSGEDSCRIVQIESTSKQSTYLESGMISEQNVISAHSGK